MKVTIYGRSTGCKFCDAAKLVCESNKIDFEFNEVTADNRSEIEGVIGTPFRTVPQIVVNGELVGGYTEFRDGLVSGKFQ